MNNKQTYSFQFPVEYPNAFLSVIKDKISSHEILSIQNAVKYDIARKLEYSEQGIYVLFDILAQLKQEEASTEQKNSFLKIVK